MVAQFPSSTNVFVKNHEASGKLVVDFSRNPKKFAISRWAQIVPVSQVAGYYLEMTVEEAGRILNADGAEFAWPDNAERPAGNDGSESFEFKQFQTKRRAYTVPIGHRTVDQASWDIIAQHSAIKAQQAMTFRTQRAVTVATTAGNYANSHTSAVASIAGNSGNWGASTTARQDIKRSLNYAANIIVKDTLASIEPADLMLVLSPGCAKEISETQEIADYIKGSPEAYAYVKGDLAAQNRNIAYGLPPTLYGFEVVIENAVKVTSRKGATKATSFLLADGTPFMCARVGGLEGLYGAPSFSTISLFMKEEMTVETLDDKDNRRTKVSVVEDFEPVMTAPVSGFLFTSAV